jgi:hypothetical protein
MAMLSGTLRPAVWAANREARTLVGRLVKFGLGLAKKAEVADARMGGEEGAANLVGLGDTPGNHAVGRPFNPGVPTTSGGSPRKGRKGMARG